MINDSWRFRAGPIEKPSSEPVLYIFFVAATVCVLTCFFFFFFFEFHTVMLAERLSRLMKRVEKQERAKENKGKRLWLCLYTREGVCMCA